VFDCRPTTIGCRERGAHYGLHIYFEQNVRTLGSFARAAMYRPGIRQGLSKTRQGGKLSDPFLAYRMQWWLMVLFQPQGNEAIKGN
jgi:hypothetical protein